VMHRPRPTVLDIIAVLVVTASVVAIFAVR
jgi:hypothetical protein